MPELDQLTPRRELLDAGWLNLLGSQARLLEIHLQLWAPDLTLILSAPPDVRAAELPRASELARQSMFERRTLWSGAGGRHPLLAVPICSADDVVAAITARPLAPIEPPGSPAGSLVAATHRIAPLPADPATAGSDRPTDAGPWRDPQHTARSSAPATFTGGQVVHLRSTLQTLARLMGQHYDVLLQLGEQADELTGLRNQQELMHRFAGQRGDPSDWRLAIEFVLQQGCAATGADLALLQLPSHRAPLIARHAFPARDGIQAANKELRQLAAQIWWSMRGWPSPQIHGPLEQVLGHRAAIHGRVQAAAIRLSPVRPKAGFLVFLREGTTPFAPHQIGLLGALADQVAMSVRDADLHEDLSEFLMSTVKALVCTIEAKDRYTSGHSARVNLIAMLIGRQMNLPVDAMEALKWASILHDVGKIGMPESLLNKPGRLDDEEFEIVKQHAWRGYEVVNHIRQLKTASQAVLFHHERLDGLGYPLGISGEAIPRLARIIAVADAFDALTTRRPYRDAWSMDDAYAEITRVCGTQLDPAPVQALGELLPFVKEHRVMLESADLAA
jgi:HD-GYP domain-containing protein (c-di-GMP phosphodiesterase class II)